MSVTPEELDSDRQQKAREYAGIRHRLLLVDLGIAIVGIVIVLFGGVGIWLRNVLQPLNWQPIHGWYPFQVLVYFVAIMLAYQIITFPITYYRDYLIVSAPKSQTSERGKVLLHRYGLSTMSLKNWLLDLLKGLALSLVFSIFAVELVYLLLAAQPQTWWLWVAAALLFFSVVMANLAPVLILPLFYKFSPLPEGELAQRLLALAERAHTRVRGVFTMQLSSKTTAANAALMGLGNTRRIVLGDTMLDRYTPDEIEVVLAHELGHHVHRDIWKLIISQSLLMLGGLYLVNLVLHWAVETQHYYQGLADAATLIVMPLSNGYSRAIEYQADEYALQATQKIEPFKSAMTRLANQNLADVEPSPVIEFLLHDHPSIGKRLKHADEFAAHHDLPVQGSESRASLSAPSSEAASSTDPAGMASSGSSTPDAAH